MISQHIDLRHRVCAVPCVLAVPCDAIRMPKMLNRRPGERPDGKRLACRKAR